MVQSPLFIAEVNPLGHVVDKPIGGGLTLHVVTLAVAGALTVLVMMFVAKAMTQGAEPSGAGRYIARGKLAQMIEAICVFLRDKVAKPQLGDATDRFMPFLWTLFFFILFNNVMGLIPLLDVQHLFGAFAFHNMHWALLGGTATGNIAVTGALAIIAFIVIQVNGLRASGLKGWAKHFLGGAPLYLAPIMIPVEIMSLLIKPFALAVRLFANMVAGHTLLATIMLFTGMALAGVGLVAGGAISLVSMAAATALYFLEIFVAFLQAFIFMFLTTIFIAQLMHHEHDNHSGAHDYDEDHVPEAKDFAVPITQ